MILFFKGGGRKIFVVEAARELNGGERQRLCWLLSEASFMGCRNSIEGKFTGPRREMITPWSTNAVEICHNMGLDCIVRMEEFFEAGGDDSFDPMLMRRYDSIGQDIFRIDRRPEPVMQIDSIADYNRREGLALSGDEIAYLEEVSEKMGRRLTDSEVFGFSQVNSEHCRHKIFGGEFIIDGKAKPESLFGMIKKSTAANPNRVVSAYKDNCAFLQGPTAEQFAPRTHDRADWYGTSDFESVISIKAETHNFPTTVEPFNGAATGSGGEIRDRIAGGKGAFPLAGTAVYMTSYPRLEGGREWEEGMEEREWLYRTPEDILIKASNGASTFGNHFGQPLVCGSLLTFEHREGERRFGYDKVIMLAGGIGYGKKEDSIKGKPRPGDKVVMLGGDNYRIGMGGGAVSSVATGEYENAIELNAVQRSNPEMQKRAYNAIRALAEEEMNPIVSIHDHGAGGHLNCLSELVEAIGGRIDLERLPVGDPTLSAREIAGNESQERMGLVIAPEHIGHLRRIAERERAPMYVIGETTGDNRFTFVDNRTGEKPIDWPLEYMFGKAPKTVIADRHVEQNYKEAEYIAGDVVKYIEQVLQIEAVACKDWLTNKVDRSVTGRVAMQQCAGEIQLPINDCAVVALDYRGEAGMATALGHAPVAAMTDAAEGSRLAIAEALTNIVFAPLTHGLRGVSLSANWMWPCRNEGEDARLYDAVEAASNFATTLGINIPTGKDSLSMTQKYRDGETVLAPGTVIITSAAEVSDIKKSVKAALKPVKAELLYVDFSRSRFELGGSSFAQTMNRIGGDTPAVSDPGYLARTFEAVQQLVKTGDPLSGHDVSAGGLVTALVEMCFASGNAGMRLDLAPLGEPDIVRVLLSEKPAVVLQLKDAKRAQQALAAAGVDSYIIGASDNSRVFEIKNGDLKLELPIDKLRDLWFRTSYLLDRRQSGQEKALERLQNYKRQPLLFNFPASFTGRFEMPLRHHIKAATIREKGSQCERESAWALYIAGFEVKDIHMTDLVSGREALDDVNLIMFVGGFSNSDVLGSAKGWAGAFLYNERAKEALERFYAREDTLSLGVCNGCQLMIELGLVTPEHEVKPRMLHNESRKFESGFVGVEVPQNSSVMLGSMSGTKLGAWIAHGEGRFSLPCAEKEYNIALKYTYNSYPANPNGSDYNVAGIASSDGRHLAMMPHPERALYPWNWAHYPDRDDKVSPWVEMFINACKWIEAKLP